MGKELVTNIKGETGPQGPPAIPFKFTNLADIQNAKSGLVNLVPTETMIPALPTQVLGFIQPDQDRPGILSVQDYSSQGFPGATVFEVTFERGGILLVGTVYKGFPQGMVPDPAWTFRDSGLPFVSIPDMVPVSTGINEWNNLQVSASALINSVMKRDGAGRSQVTTPSGTLDITNKKFVDDYFINRAPFAPSAGANKYLSVTSNAAWQQILVDTVNSANSVVQRKAGGQVDVALTPSAITDAASKNYVDTGGWVTAPATASSPGTKGQKAFDTSYLYICVATNGWARVPLTVW